MHIVLFNAADTYSKKLRYGLTVAPLRPGEGVLLKYKIILLFPGIKHDIG